MAVNAQINVNLNTGNSEKNINQVVGATKSLRAQLKEIQNELNNLDEGSDRFQELANRAGELKDQIQDTQEVIAATAGNITERLGTALNGVAQVGVASFQAITSAQALFGTESEAIQKTLLRVQAAAGLADAIKTFGGLDGVLVQVKASAISAAQAMGLITVATEAETTAQEGLNAAMKVNPIGLIIAGVTTLIGLLAIFNSKTEENTKEQEKSLAAYKARVKAQEESIKTISEESSEFVGLLYQLKESNKGSKERKDLIKEINKEYGTTLKNLSDEAEFQKQVNKEVENYIQYQTVKLRIQKNEEAFNLVLQRKLELETKIQNAQSEAERVARKLNITVGEYYRNNSEVVKSLEQWNAQLSGAEFKLNKYTNRILVLKSSEDELTNSGKKYGEQTDKNTEKTDKNSQSLKDAKDIIDNVINGINKLTEAQFKLGEYEFGKDLEQALKNQQNLIKQTGQYDVEFINNLINNQKKVEENYIISQQNIKKSNATTQDEIQAIDTETYLLLEQNDDKYKDLKTKSYSDLEKAQEDYANQVVETDKKTIQKQKVTWDDYTKSISKSWKESWQNTLSGLLDMAANIIGSIAQSLQNVFEVQAQKATYERESRYKQELDSYQLMLDQQLISREEYDTKISLLNQQKEQEERMARGKAFKQQKAFNLVNAIMSGAQAVVQGFATQPFVPLGIAMGALAGILTATQIGVISSQQFTAAKGGIVPGSGPGNIDSVPSLLAPGEAVINSNSTMMFGDLLSAINEMGGGQSLVPNTPNGGTSMVRNSIFAENDRTPIRAYVVESEMTDKQKRVSRIERTASFG